MAQNELYGSCCASGAAAHETLAGIGSTIRTCTDYQLPKTKYFTRACF